MQILARVWFTDSDKPDEATRTRSTPPVCAVLLTCAYLETEIGEAIQTSCRR